MAITPLLKVMTEHEAYVAFNMVPNIGSVKLSALIARYGSAAAAWEAYPEKKNRAGKVVDWKAEIELAGKKNVTLIDCSDSRYPASLNDLQSKPLVLYVAGNPDVLSMPGIAVVGTRLPTLYGTDMAEKFSMGIAQSAMSVISGLAVGVDAYAHKGALASGGVTIGVLGSAFDRFFPDENRELGRRIISCGGAVISEYPFGFPPGAKTFPQRNRIVAALSCGVLAVECPVQSGTLITCDIAKKLGRRVMAIPANLDSKHSAGCWKLIRAGALMVTDVNDVVGSFVATPVKELPDRKKAAEKVLKKTPTTTSPPSQKPLRKPELSLEEAAVLKAIPSIGITLDRLAFKTKLPAPNIADATMSLRLKGLIRFLPGNRVAPAKDV